MHRGVALQMENPAEKCIILKKKKAPEVSQELNVSATNLWKILQRSRVQLRECLEVNWFLRS